MLLHEKNSAAKVKQGSNSSTQPNATNRITTQSSSNVETRHTRTDQPNESIDRPSSDRFSVDFLSGVASSSNSGRESTVVHILEFLSTVTEDIMCSMLDGHDNTLSIESMNSERY